MKAKTFFVLSLVFAFSSAFCGNVNKKTAEIVAKNCYFQQMNLFEAPVDYNNIEIESTTLKEQNGTPIMYVVEFVGGGYVLVSAQESMVPVLGFNTTPGLKFDTKDRGPEYNYFINYMMNVIENLANVKYPQEEYITKEWKAYTTHSPETLIANKDRDVEVGPLLSTTWNQDYPYNYYAPLDEAGPGGRCYAGCVATAMSVVMNYWGWPIQGEGQTAYYASGYGVQSANFGETTYRWDLMPTALSTAFPDSVIFASALIQYHAGVSVQMMYDPDGSGAYSAQVPYAVQTYFKYPTASYYQKSNTSSWESTLIQQLSQGYVLYHNGQASDGGHAWNCDGYRTIGTTTTFHHNFNWGGYQNDWFTSANPGGFTSSQAVVINFYPPAAQYPIYATGHTVLTSTWGRISDGSGPVKNYQANTTATWLIDPERETDSIDYITLSWEQFDLAAGDYIKVYDGADESAELIGEYTGTELPGSITSSTQYLFLKFVTTTGNGSGFVFNYNAHRVKLCNTMTNITNGQGTIVSNPENKYYNPNTLCRWQIKYPYSTGMILTFNYLHTYDENDFVEIYDLTTQDLYTFYGNETPSDPIEISAGGCVVTLKSDGLISEGNGFSLNYIDKNVGMENYVIGDVEVFPSPANDLLNIRFESTEANDLEIKIVNTTGSLMYKELLPHTSFYSNTIDVNTYPSGVYFISFTSAKGTTTKKIVIE